MTARDLANYRETLAQSVVFQHLAPAELDRIIAHCQLIDLDAGHVVLHEGQLGDGLYVILEGEVEVFLPQRRGGVKRITPVRLNVLGRGRCFGEYGLIDDQATSAAVQTLTPARLCLLRRDDFHSIIRQSDRIGRIIYLNLLRFLIDRLRVKDTDLDHLVFAEEKSDRG